MGFRGLGKPNWKWFGLGAAALLVVLVAPKISGPAIGAVVKLRDMIGGGR